VLRTRRLEHQPFVYMWLDATYVHVRKHDQIVSQGRSDRHRLPPKATVRSLGVDIGNSENETFGPSSSARWSTAALPRSSWSSPTPTRGAPPPSAGSCQGATWQRRRLMPSPTCSPLRSSSTAALSPRRSRPSSPRTTPSRPERSCVTWSTSSPRANRCAERLQAMEDDRLAYAPLPPAHRCHGLGAERARETRSAEAVRRAQSAPDGHSRG
jgi:putative transposase